MLRAELARGDRHERLCRTGYFTRHGSYLRYRKDRRDAVAGEVLGELDAVTAALQRRRDDLVRVGLETDALVSIPSSRFIGPSIQA